MLALIGQSIYLAFFLDKKYRLIVKFYKPRSILFKFICIKSKDPGWLEYFAYPYISRGPKL
jgi:hypothetical protein